ncbi:MAG: hypothetical protein JZU58_28470 [Curvibacter lanceolatus]|uniref:phage tail terminator protein n=1 Tax=Curvibacter lanceolatus TaxID=86182 RepID=UPI0023536488|nr:hypothetical protein [Curvibacter lanceolatus]MBV5296293.1 hypothetical protein [Curvibacter lanceolatus]
MDLQFVIDRLKGQLSGIRQLGGAADLDTAFNGSVSVPAVFVMPQAEKAAVTAMATGLVRQTFAQNWGVIVVVSNRRDAAGSAALADLASLRQAVRLALVGWVPDAVTGEPVYATGGQLVRLDGEGRLWWGDSFELKTYFRSN